MLRQTTSVPFHLPANQRHLWCLFVHKSSTCRLVQNWWRNILHFLEIQHHVCSISINTLHALCAIFSNSSARSMRVMLEMLGRTNARKKLLCVSRLLESSIGDNADCFRDLSGLALSLQYLRWGYHSYISKVNPFFRFLVFIRSPEMKFD